MDNTPAEKVYVAVGNDLQDGFKTLEWTLRKWSSHPISIVILHVTYNISKEYVYTPFGKLPASAVSEEKLEVLKKFEQEKIDKFLSKYITFCGKVKAEILKVKKNDEPIQKLILDLISELQITKLVMGFTFMKSSSWKSKSTISGSFYVFQNKPDFCELYIICGGKQVFLKGQNDEGIMEDDQGVVVGKVKDKASFKDWIEKIFTDPSAHSSKRNSRLSPTSSIDLDTRNSQNQWETHVEEIESYFQLLVASDLDEDNNHDQDNNNPTESDLPEYTDSNLCLAEKIESLRRKISEAQQTVQLKRKEAKENVKKHSKAQRILSLCSQRTEELEAWIKEEVKMRMEMEKELEAEKEHMSEVVSDIEESKSRLGSVVELQNELSNKLQISTLAKTHAEAQLEKAVRTRGEMVRDIEELRRQRDVLNRRIEFCREKDAISMVAKVNELNCGYREYTIEEIRSATHEFSESLRLKSGGDWSNVYRGRMKHGTVAIKTLNSSAELSDEVFHAKVNLLGHIRHPNLVAMVGFCLELKCMVFEYMHNGSLRDLLFSSHGSSFRTRSRALRWHDRISVAVQVCLGLSFLHLIQPRPMVHGHLSTSSILLDRNHVAKISGYEFSQEDHDEYVSDVGLDIRAFGVVMCELLTGKNWAGLVEETMTLDKAALVQNVDETAGDWPLDSAEEFAGLALRCLSIDCEPNTDLNISRVMGNLNKIKDRADALMARGGPQVVSNDDDTDDVPRVFICPIFQDIMKEPYVAADGFSYELEAISEWLSTGHDTSPMTNLRLIHTDLTPNRTLRSLIQDWQNKTSRRGSSVQ